MNLFTPIWNRAHVHPERAAFIYQGRQVSYGLLARSATIASARLAQAGIGRSDVVVLSLANPVAYISIALGVARLGATVLPLNIAQAGSTEELLARHHVHTVVRDHSEEWRSSSAPGARYLTGAEVLAGVASGETPPEVPPIAANVGDEPWIIVLSSGTTGTPKSIPHTHDRAVMNSCLSISGRAESGQRVLVFAGYFISMAMNAVMRDLYCGNTVVLTSTRSPEEFFTTVERDKPTHVVTSTGTAVQLVAYAERQLPDSLSACSSVVGITLAGSAVSPTLRNAVQTRICAGLEINYGSSEAGGMVLATPETIAAHPHSAGRMHPWVEIQAVNENDEPLPAGQVGALRVKTPLLVKGYLEDPEATARSFRNGWYYPGDTGSIDDAGFLTLKGRVDELLNLGGNKVDPFLIEAVLDEQPGVRESCVVAVATRDGGTALIALVVRDGELAEATLRKACLDRLGPRYVPARVLETKSIPRNSGGKIMRKEIATRIQIDVRNVNSSP